MEDLIRAALERSGSATDPGRVRATLADRVRAHRQRRTMVIACGAAVAVAAIGAVPFVRASLDPNELPSAPPPSCTIRIYLTPEATPEQTTAIDTALHRIPEARVIDYQSRDKAYQQFVLLFRDTPDVIVSVQRDAFPASFSVITYSFHRRVVADGIRGMPGVSQIIDGCEVTGNVPVSELPFSSRSLRDCQVSVYFRPDLTVNQIAAVEEMLRRLPSVRMVKYDSGGLNKLPPPAFRITSDPDSHKAVADAARGVPGVSEVVDIC